MCDFSNTQFILCDSSLNLVFLLCQYIYNYSELAAYTDSLFTSKTFVDKEEYNPRLKYLLESMSLWQNYDEI